MDNWESNWNVRLFLIYVQVLVAYSKCKSIKRREQIKWDLETLRAGFLPVKYLDYL